MAKVIAFVGRKGAGCSDVLSCLIEDLAREGYQVGVLKHLAKTGVEIDQPGKDTYKFRTGGANKVVISGQERLAVFENRLEERSLEENLQEFEGYDFVFLLGYFTSSIPTIEICNSDKECFSNSNLVAVYNEKDCQKMQSVEVLHSPEALFQFVLEFNPNRLEVCSL